MQRKLIKNLLLVLTLVVLCLAVGMTVSAETWGDYEYDVLDNGTIEITDYKGSDSKLEIPTEIDGKPVTVIGYRAFAGSANLEEIKIATSVEIIGDGAFLDCVRLNSINIPENVISIGYACFEWCFSLNKIYVDENNKYYSNDEYGVLFNKDKTTLIQYPIGNKNIEYHIPDSVINIADGAFYYAFNISELFLPDSLKNIEAFAFQACFNLTKITIPNNVDIIGDYAFYWLFFLDKIVIKTMDAALGEYAICASDCIVTDISCEGFTDLARQYFISRDETFFAEMEKHMVRSDDIIFIGTVHCHPGSTAEAYAIENGIDYVLTHFYEGEWSYDYDNLVKYRKCIHCDELETEAIEPEVPTEPDTPTTPDEETKDDFFSKIFELIKAFIDLLFGWMKK